MTRWRRKLVENLQRPSGYASPACVMLVVLGLVMLAGQPRAGAATPSPWDAATQSRARLIAGGGLIDGHYNLGVEIELQDGAHTYWRSPGDSGVPPEFLFEGSQNLGGVDVAFPAPRRLMESGSEIFGYLDHVVLPLRVAPADPKKPLMLDLKFNYATCRQICVPASATLSITLHPDDAGDAQQTTISQWQARVPRPLPPAEAPRADGPSLVITIPSRALASAPGNPLWHVQINPDLPNATLFPESPLGWFVIARKSATSGFDLEAVEHPADASAARSLPLALTIVSDEGSLKGAWQGSFNLPVPLDGASARP